MKSKNRNNFGVGRTIAEEREKLESESERFHAREKAKNRQTFSIVVFTIGLIAIGILVTIGVKSLAEEAENPVTVSSREKVEPTVEIVDESGAGITNRVREFVGQLEKDAADLDYKIERVAVPAGKRREVDVYLKDIPYYIKMNIDRGTAVSAEDMDRMVRHLATLGVTPGYVDVRVEGKAYYK